MKKTLMILIALMAIKGLFATTTNTESIYGKDDRNINNNYGHIYGNNFGSLIESDVTRPYSMDIDVANEEIELLLAQNVSYENETNDYKADVILITGQIAELYDVIERIDTIMNSVINSSVELYTLNNSLTDSEMKQKLQISIEENRQQKYDLENKLLELNGKLGKSFESLDVKKKYITVNSLNVRRNVNRIKFLKTCIELSTKDTGALDLAVNRSSSLQSEVDALLSIN